ncbi:MAG: S9 family peptidase [Chitinophagaceae bacterium]|nr:S9 family peptidase [Chitinophagaceae bacterium]
MIKLIPVTMRTLMLWAAANLSILWAAAQLQPVQVTDMLLIKTAGSISLTADGSKVAYTLTDIVPDEKNAGEHRYRTQIWVGEAAGSSSPRQFTHAPEGASQPSWSPDGSQLAFVRQVMGIPQIFVTSMQGGEAQQLTFLPTGASGPVWSTNGRQLVFSSSIPVQQYLTDSVLNPARLQPAYSFEKPGLTTVALPSPATKANANGSLDEVRAYLRQNEADRKAKVINKLNFQQEATTSGEMNINHLFIMAAEPGAKPKILTSGFHSYSNAQFVAGTPMIVAESAPYPGEHPDRQQERAIYIMDTLGQNLKLWFGEPGYAVGGARVSPSGKWIAFTKTKTNRVGIGAMYICGINDIGADAKPAIQDISLQQSKWADNDAGIYFTANTRGGSVLYFYQMGSRQLKPLTAANEGITDYDVSGNRLVLAKTAIESPSELYTGNADATSLAPLAVLNAWTKTRLLSKPEKGVFVNDIGLEVDYWIMKPAQMATGKKYPVLLEIHGGPSAMWGPGESSMWHEFQYFCSKGYGVVYCNPRGSGGSGEKFLRGNINDWGNGPMNDVMTALNKATQQPWADTSKLFVTGGSYAGYLVAYILGHHQRFKAACAQRGVYDLRTFLGEGNAWRLVPNYFGGYPWQPDVLKLLEKESPVNYVANIKTPLIIFHGEQDLRTGVIQSEQLYKSLKILGRPVEYVRHPGATHEITRSGNNRQRIDQMLRTWEFFERFQIP